MGDVRSVKELMNKLIIKILQTLTQNSPLAIMTYGRSCLLRVSFNNKNGYISSPEGGNLYVKNSGS